MFGNLFASVDSTEIEAMKTTRWSFTKRHHINATSDNMYSAINCVQWISPEPLINRKVTIMFFSQDMIYFDCSGPSMTCTSKLFVTTVKWFCAVYVLQTHILLCEQSACPIDRTIALSAMRSAVVFSIILQIPRRNISKPHCSQTTATKKLLSGVFRYSIFLNLISLYIVFFPSKSNSTWHITTLQFGPHNLMWYIWLARLHHCLGHQIKIKFASLTRKPVKNSHYVALLQILDSLYW